MEPDLVSPEADPSPASFPFTPPPGGEPSEGTAPFTPPPGSNPPPGGDPGTREAGDGAVPTASAAPAKPRPWLWWAFVVFVIALVSVVGSFYVITKAQKAVLQGRRPPNYAQSGSSEAAATTISFADLLKALGQANEIHLVSPDIASKSFLNELVAARQRNAKVFVFTDPSKTRTIDYLTAGGFAVGTNLFLAKNVVGYNFVMVDQSVVFTGSTGFTPDTGKGGYSIITGKENAHKYLALMKQLVTE